LQFGNFGLDKITYRYDIEFLYNNENYPVAILKMSKPPRVYLTFLLRMYNIQGNKIK